MFTDLVGFTEMVERVGDDEGRRIIEFHNDFIRDIVEFDGSGKVHKYIGDAILATFTHPSEGISRALEIQRRLPIAPESRLGAGPFRARSGAVRGLPETVFRGFRTDRNRLEQNIVFRIACHDINLPCIGVCRSGRPLQEPVCQPRRDNRRANQRAKHPFNSNLGKFSR